MFVEALVQIRQDNMSNFSVYYNKIELGKPMQKKQETEYLDQRFQL